MKIAEYYYTIPIIKGNVTVDLEGRITNLFEGETVGVSYKVVLEHRRWWWQRPIIYVIAKGEVMRIEEKEAGVYPPPPVSLEPDTTRIV